MMQNNKQQHINYLLRLSSDLGDSIQELMDDHANFQQNKDKIAEDRDSQNQIFHKIKRIMEI